MAHTLTKVNLAEKLAMFDTHFDPKIVAQYNGNDIMVVKFTGEVPFHIHEESDDFFLILEGEVTLEVETGNSVTLRAGELCVIPAGVVHRPRAESEAKVLLIEPAGMPNTGNAETAAAKPWI